MKKCSIERMNMIDKDGEKYYRYTLTCEGIDAVNVDVPCGLPLKEVSLCGKNITVIMNDGRVYKNSI